MWVNSPGANKNYDDNSRSSLWPRTDLLPLWAPEVKGTAAVLRKTTLPDTILDAPGMGESSSVGLSGFDTSPTISSDYLLATPTVNSDPTDEGYIQSAYPRLRLDVQKLRAARSSPPRISDPDDEIVPFLPRNQRPPIVPIGGGRGYLSWQ